MRLAIHPYIYKGDYQVDFIKKENGLSATIETDRLSIRSVTAEDIPSYTTLFGDREIMQRSIFGRTKSREEVANRVNDWIELWKKGNPFSSLTILDKERDEFLGQAVLGYSDAPGQAEFRALFVNKAIPGLEAEATTAIVKGYATEAAKKGYKVYGKVLEMVTTTTRNNGPTPFLLEKLGMTLIPGNEKYAPEHNDYFIHVKKL